VVNYGFQPWSGQTIDDKIGIVHYVIKFVSDLRQIIGFFPVSYTNKTDRHDICVKVCRLTSSVVNYGFQPWLGQTIDDKIGICCFSAKHAALRSKSKDWMAPADHWFFSGFLHQ
jgi:hypothetical protein